MSVGYIEDYVRPQAFAAVKGQGCCWPATLAGGPIFAVESEARAVADSQRSAAPRERRREVMLLEAGRPDRHHFRVSGAHRHSGERRSSETYACDR